MYKKKRKRRRRRRRRRNRIRNPSPESVEPPKPYLTKYSLPCHLKTPPTQQKTSTRTTHHLHNPYTETPIWLVSKHSKDWTQKPSLLLTLGSRHSWSYSYCCVCCEGKVGICKFCGNSGKERGIWWDPNQVDCVFHMGLGGTWGRWRLGAL